MINRNQNTDTPIKNALSAIRTMVWYAILTSSASAALSVWISFFSLNVLDKAIPSGNLDTLGAFTFLVIVAYLVNSAITGGRAFVMSKISSWFEYKIADAVLHNAIKTSLVAKSNAGSQSIRDLQTLCNYIASNAPVMLIDAPWSLVFTIILFLIHPMMGTLALIGSIAIIIVGVVNERYTKKLVEKHNENFIASMKYVDNLTRGAEVLESMGMSRRGVEIWHKINLKVNESRIDNSKRQAFATEFSKLVRGILQVFTTLTGAYLVIKGEITSGAMITGSTLVSKALEPWGNALNAVKNVLNVKKAYERLNSGFRSFVHDEELMQMPATEGVVSIENVYYAPHGSNTYFIKAINMHMKPGQVCALIGPSGSGKSTLLSIIAGAKEPGLGIVRIDGSDRKNLRKEDLGSSIGYLPQDVQLLSGTVKMNISRLDADANYEDIIQAAQIVGAHEMITRLPNGYDTDVGVDGSNLSGGQKQAIGLARAFYKMPQIVLLDEAEASLDDSSRVNLVTAIEVLKEQKATVVLVTHNPMMLQLADTVVVMRSGEIVMSGPYAEVTKALQQKQKIQ
ncbi:putative type I secretion system permease/ATPase [Candidatus Fokinia solitaria]|uniref:Putative type I secretion system permease/ATPase n=1 Tax=Candidatus Fokinia solitaria TaxID=1802984 RepID=A0A2U8BRC3_9RICK|nr:type I secretion system permease/ATPase [Candidatus Fokinia solitaria]AWD32878.1 putative type I secretion system permease/ATPase [Candidatus Fokinia solitaria]